MMPNSFLIVVGEPLSPSSDAVYSHDRISLYTRTPNPGFIQVDLGNGFELFIGELLKQTDRQACRRDLPAGTRITFQQDAQCLEVLSDRLGTTLIYWRQDNNRLLVSNRKENLVTEANSPDWSGIQQYLHRGYTLRNATLLRGIYQTEPDTRLSISLGPELRISEEPDTVTALATNTGQDELIERIADRLSHKLSCYPPSVLMMSAGWDSRTLLLNQGRELAGAYSHGDLSSREIGLARKLTGAQRLDHLFVDVQSCEITPELIDQMLQELGSAVFPIWFVAARNIRAWKNAPIMSGVLGELLGGHYGLTNWGSRSQKLFSYLSLLNKKPLNDRRMRAGVDRYCTPPLSHWFVSSHGQDILDTHRQETKESVLTTIEHYHRRNSDWKLALENFNMAHRARQYILKQAHVTASISGYTLPFADPTLADLTRALEFTARLHNKANQRILKTRQPGLLDEPLAATLISARYPILWQEISRMYRITRENLSLALGREKPRLGWFNYEHLYQTDLLHTLVDTLNHEMWDKTRMHQAIDSNPQNGIDAGSTLDMLTKIKTVDHYLK